MPIAYLHRSLRHNVARVSAYPSSLHGSGSAPAATFLRFERDFPTSLSLEHSSRRRVRKSTSVRSDLRLHRNKSDSVNGPSSGLDTRLPYLNLRMPLRFRTTRSHAAMRTPASPPTLFEKSVEGMGPAFKKLQFKRVDLANCYVAHDEQRTIRGNAVPRRVRKRQQDARHVLSGP